MSEVRPWIGSYLTVAQFRLLNDLRFVDCSADQQKSLLNVYADSRKWEGEVWWGINRAFFEPVSPSDNVADYAPTQVLAEAFRHSGYDGVVYRSVFGKGLNVAVFSPQLAKLVTRLICETSSVQFSFSRVPFPVKQNRNVELSGSRNRG